jgi:translocation and assembly module TamB
VDALHGGGSAAGRTGEASMGTLAALRAQGALQFDPAWQQPLRWHGRLQQLDARQRGGNAPAPWFRVGEADLDAQFDPLTLTPKVIVSAGRAELTSLALRWNELRWQGGAAPRLDLQAEIEPFVVAPLLARLQPDFGWGGDLIVGGHAVIHSSPSLVAQVEFGRRRGDLNVTDEAGTLPVELTDLRLALDAQGGVWTFTQAVSGDKLGAITGTLTARTDAKALWPPANAPLRGAVELRIANLATWGAWVPAGWRLKGALHAVATFGGLFGAPEYLGRIEGSGLGARNLVEGIDVHDGELDIALDGRSAKIVKMQARAGDGSMQFSGGMAFGDSPEAKLRVVADHLLLLGRVDRHIVASGDAALKLDAHAVQLDGRITIDQGLIDISRGNAPTLGSDVHVQREPVVAQTDEPAARNAPTRDVKLNMALNLGPALRLRGRGIDTHLQGELLLTSPNGRLAASGTINAVQGTYAAYGQRLEIERGAISFNGAIDNPRLDILALRPNLDIQVGVAITGSANTPRIALYSEPDLPDNEKLSWLVLGRAPEGLPGSDTALLQAAAMALLAGEGEGPASQLLGLNPLDTLSVRQSEGAVRDTVVSVGKQLSQRWYIGYERSLTATAGNWQLIYRLGQRFTVRMQAGIDNAIDLIWSWRWD